MLRSKGSKEIRELPVQRCQVMHIVARLLTRNIRPATEQVTMLDDGISEYHWVDKGSVIQRVTDEWWTRQDSILIRDRWKALEHDWPTATIWVVRDGWFQFPIFILWQWSLAVYYIWRGLRWTVGRRGGVV